MFSLFSGGMHEGSAGQICGDGSHVVFSHGRVRSVTLLGSISTAPKAGPVHLGHPYLLLPTLHTLPPQHQGPRRPDDGGAGFSLRLRKTLCLLPMGFKCPTQDQKGCESEHSKLYRRDSNVLDHKHTRAHIKQHFDCHFHSSSFYIHEVAHPGAV